MKFVEGGGPRMSAVALSTWQLGSPERRFGVEHGRGAGADGVARTDLYQQHWPSPMFPPGPTMPRMRTLVEKGLVSHVGVSNHSLAQWQAAEKAFGGQGLSNPVPFRRVHRTTA